MSNRMLLRVSYDMASMGRSWWEWLVVRLLGERWVI